MFAQAHHYPQTYLERATFVIKFVSGLKIDFTITTIAEEEVAHASPPSPSNLLLC